MSKEQFISDSEKDPTNSHYHFKWKSPSNLALVKYWGKYGRQYPQNASLSFTLDAAHSITEMECKLKTTSNSKIDLNFYFEGKAKPSFENKIINYFHSITDHLPFLTEYSFKISSMNSFPHSSGIASSASAMSALALCLVSLEEKVLNKELSKDQFLERASLLARLGSGSASRSVYAYMGLWGKHNQIKESSNDYAIPYSNGFDPIFKDFHDDILIVSKNEKSVSSSAGHALMEDNIYAESRYKQANQRLTHLIHAMKEGDLDVFGKIVEDEALSLHALMMCSNPSYILIEPNTLNLISAIRNYRTQTGVPVYFSLDAGPNIHLLYPDNHSDLIERFIEEDLKTFCLQIIKDKLGSGPQRLI